MAARRDSLLASLLWMDFASQVSKVAPVGRVAPIARIATAFALVAAIAIPLGGCGPAVPEYTLVPSADGAPIKLERKRHLPLGEGDSALLLSYRTDLAIDDASALRAEVDEVWRTFREEAEKAGAQAILIEARALTGERWSRIGRSRRFAFRRGPSSTWRLVERGAARTTAVKPL